MCKICLESQNLIESKHKKFYSLLTYYMPYTYNKSLAMTSNSV